MSTLTVRRSLVVAKPRAEVFAAFVEPAQMARYFVSSSGPLEPGKTVIWTSGDMSDETHCHELVPNERVVLGWKAYKIDYQTRFELTLTDEPNNRTKVTIEETGWKQDQASIESALEHSSGWTHMLLCLKAYLEHGIDLRM